MAGLPPATRKNKEYPEMGQSRSCRSQHGLASVPKTVEGGIEMKINVINVNKHGKPFDIRGYTVDRAPETEAFYNLIAAHELKTQRKTADQEAAS